MHASTKRRSTGSSRSLLAGPAHGVRVARPTAGPSVARDTARLRVPQVCSYPSRDRSFRRPRTRRRKRGGSMPLLVLVALLAIIAFGVGFTIHWLFIVAVVAALLWVISLFAGG